MSSHNPCFCFFFSIDRRQNDGVGSILQRFHRDRLTILTEFVEKLTWVKLRKWFNGLTRSLTTKRVVVGWLSMIDLTMDRGLRGVAEGKSSLRVQVPVEFNKSAQREGDQPQREGENSFTKPALQLRPKI